ncbi:VPS13 [[Candida] subhashii]|uniref:Vacuolar protein sorting-associated protein n=1 Tax=[Candida] subhashii TaxID=561895 RepID=A0A8J5QU89_9ASCO|nr:VPS13 [[Candida] subhashii]KAG7665092.1 VPS13 [[Candida] subhashii]
MFESLVANLLNRFLGSYLENFDPKQLNIGIWGGDVKLKNLRLKKESLDSFKLPIDVKFGHLGELTLQIPWSNLKSKPVRIIIEDLYILASPIILENDDDEEEEIRAQNLKRERLSQLETSLEAQQQNKDLADELSGNESFTESLITKIVDNLQVTIKNIHIRYEDDSVLAETPYAIGLTLQELSAVSTDEKWEPSFISITKALTHKLLTLKNLSCYMNTKLTSTTSIYTEDKSRLLRSFKKGIEYDDDITIEYLLKPVSGSGKLTVHKPGTTETIPHIKADLFFDEFGVELNSQQYQDMLWTASKFHWYMRTFKFRKLRPKLSPNEAPRAWFQYAAKAVYDEIHERNYKWSWDYFAKRRDQRIAYKRLWKLKLSGKLTHSKEIEELEDLEWDLPFEDIKFYRSLTRNELRAERQDVSLFHTGSTDSTNSNTQENNSGGGWFSGWWSSVPPSTDAELEKHEKFEKETDPSKDPEKLGLALTKEQKKALFEAIDYDENQELANIIDIPKDWVKMEISAQLNKGGLTIKQPNSNLAEIIFEGCRTQIYERPDSFLTRFQIDEFRVEDGTGTTLYKHIVSVKQAHSHLHEDTVSIDASIEEDPFFQISFENNPLDGSADSILLGKLKSMTIFYNPKFIQEIIKFFTPPKIHLDTVGAIMNAAEATVEGLTSQTRMGLEYALEEHKTINVKLDLQAPLVIMPLDPSSFKSPVAILDAGHISVISDLVDKDRIQEVKEKESYTADDWKTLQDLMYDQFQLTLEDAQFLVGPNIKSTMEQLHSQENIPKNKSAMMLDKFNFQFLLGVSILPDATNLARFKISGHVPDVNIAINDFQYKTVLQILENAIPSTEMEESETSLGVFDSLVGNLNKNGDINVEEEFEKSVKKLVTDPNSQQRLLEFDFSVGSVHASLSRCIDGVTLEAEPLVDLIGDSLTLHFHRTINDMHVDLYLSDINLVDYIEKSGIPEFHNLISSLPSRSGQSKHLLEVSYDRIQRLAEFNGKEIEVFDQDIKIQLATVKFIVSRKSILSLLNFVLNTFTDPVAAAPPVIELNQASIEDGVGPEKINVDISLDSIILVLNEDSMKLATIELSSAHFDVLVLPELLDVKGKLGAFTVLDEINQGSPPDSPLRNLIHMKGNNLAEFSYIMYDPLTNKRPISSIIDIKTGAMTINFVESSFNRILAYLNQFLRMKAIYDSAREAAINQVAQIQDINTIKFNLLVEAPTIVFPSFMNGFEKCNKLVANLGEIYAYNEFKDLANCIEFGIRNVSLMSQLYFESVEQKAKIVQGLDIAFDVKYIAEYVPETPSFVVNGKTPELNLSLTELQAKILIQLSESITRAFTFEENENLEDIEEEAAFANEVLKHNTQLVQGEQQNTENENFKDANETIISPDHKLLSLNFEIPRVSLVIFNGTSGVVDLDPRRLSSFTVNKVTLELDMNQETHLNANLTVKSFVVEDVRKDTTSKFPILIPAAEGVENQFVLQATTEGAKDRKHMTVLLKVEKPKTILALDYIFELSTFFNKAMPQPTEKEVLPEHYAASKSSKSFHSRHDQRRKSVSSMISQLSSPSSAPAAEMTIGYSLNIIEPSVILLADDAREDTEAVVFKTEQILIASQNIISLAANNIGMYLTQMNDFDTTTYRIIDDYSISFSYDSRGSTPTNVVANIQASVDALVLRVSLRDIRLALNILNRANHLYSKAQGIESSSSDEGDNKLSVEFKRRLSQYAPSIVSTLSHDESLHREEVQKVVDVLKNEEMNVAIGGVRFVLIGDVSELPVLDINVKPFEVHAANWSTNLTAVVHFEQYVNIFNYSRSSWEPLVEPWPISVYVSKAEHPKPKLLIEAVSKQLSEITVTSRSVALLSQISDLLTTDQKLKPRGQDNPYVIVNETGYDLQIWSEDDDVVGSKKEVKSNESVQWAFEDWRKIRENLDADNAGRLGISFVDSPYEDLRNVSATNEGENLHILYPPIDGVHNRLSVETILREDNIKEIKLKSTVVVENDADIPIEVEITYGVSKKSQIIIQSKKCQALPIDSVYTGMVRVRPHIHTPYGWSDESLYWKDLLKGGASLRCPAQTRDDSSVYYFQTEAAFNKEELLGRIYPHLHLVISSPLEIENLLPYDIDYRLYDKNSKRDWIGSIKKGVKSYVHVVSLDNLLLLSVVPRDSGYERSEFAIINRPHSSEFKRENVITLRDKQNNILKLRIYYPRKKQDSSSLKIVLYSPYVIVNKSKLNLVVNESGSTNKVYLPGKSVSNKQAPIMFSFDRFGDRKNRAKIRAENSMWSEQMSFDAIGQSSEVKLRMMAKQVEDNLGVTISEGEGKYNLSKVVTVAPRYVLINKLDDELCIVESGTTKQQNLSPGQLLPFYGLRSIDNRSILVKFSHGSKSFSPAFGIDDVGQLFIKVFKNNIGQVLVKVNILLENGTIYISLENGNNEWPFSIRNFTDEEIYIYQNDPNINATGEQVRHDTPYKPIYYKVPAKSVMPYAYDYPNAIIKELIVRAHGRERAVNLAEIGNLKPFRLPPTVDAQQTIVDLNVVADGPTQSLVITKYDPAKSLYKLQAGGASSSTANVSTTNGYFKPVEATENYHTKIVTKFEGFGISLVNTKNQELCYITLKGLELRYNESDLYQTFSMKLKWIQIDNQLYGGIFPIILYPSVIPKAGNELSNHPAFSTSVCRVKGDSHGVMFIKYATILLQEMTFEIDEDFLFALLEFSKFPGAAWNKQHIDRLCEDGREIKEPERLAESNDVYFEALHLQPIKANISFVRTERINAEDKGSSQNTLMFFFNVLTMAIGNINDAPIKLNALFIENIRVPIPILMDSVQIHYSQAFFYQLHNILGSADFLGNPVGLFNQISSGVLDIFYEPYQGFVLNDNPQELGIGIAKGGLSFLKKSVFGFSDSLAKVTGSIAKGLTVATMDQKFQERRRLNTKRNKPKHALYGFASGANSFIDSIASGVTGVATAPIEGAAEEGAVGFFKGLGKGVIGLPTKAAIGIFDLASNVSEGIKNTTTVFDNAELDKVRLPRFIPPNSIIKPYSEREAKGQFWMHNIDGGIFYNETYVAHLVLAGDEMAVLVTYKKILLFDITELKRKWMINFDQIKSISVEPTGLLIELKTRRGPFIPIPDKSNRNFLYSKIAIAVQEFNKHCQVVL